METKWIKFVMAKFALASLLGFLLHFNGFGKKVPGLDRCLLGTLPDIFSGAFLRKTLAVYSKNSSYMLYRIVNSSAIDVWQGF